MRNFDFGDNNMTENYFTGGKQLMTAQTDPVTSVAR